MIMYKCDGCGALTHPVEAIGAGVGANGKGYMYKDPGSDLCVVITLGFEPGDNQDGEHFCLGCMWDTLRAMTQELAPYDIDDPNPPIDTTSHQGMPELPAKEDVSRTDPSNLTQQQVAVVRHPWGEPWQG